MANRQMGLTKARVPGSREGWPTTFHLCGGKVASISLKRGCLGGPGAKSLCFSSARGLRFDPWSGAILHLLQLRPGMRQGRLRVPHFDYDPACQKPENNSPQTPGVFAPLSSALPLAPCCMVRIPANARIGGYFRGLGARGPILENQRYPKNTNTDL